MLVPLGSLWLRRDATREGCMWSERVLALQGEVAPLVEARARRTAGDLFFFTNQIDRAEQLFLESRTRFQREGVDEQAAGGRSPIRWAPSPWPEANPNRHGTITRRPSPFEGAWAATTCGEAFMRLARQNAISAITTEPGRCSKSQPNWRTRQSTSSCCPSSFTASVTSSSTWDNLDEASGALPRVPRCLLAGSSPSG